MRIEQNGMYYEDYNPDCYCEVVCGPNGQMFGFIQCVDANTGEKKRYWGFWDASEVEKSIKFIMDRGGKWPSLIPKNN